MELLSSKKTIATLMAMILGGIGVGLVAGTYPQLRDIVRNKTDHATPAETHIQQAIKDAFKLEVIVRCLPADELPGQNGHAPDKLVSFGAQIIRLRENICQDVIDFSQDPSLSNSNRANSLQTVSHEVSHVIGEKNEGLAECFGIQRTPSLARALGASSEQSDEITKRATIMMHNNSPLSDEKYTPPPGCIDGGPFDLDPSKPGIFPLRLND